MERFLSETIHKLEQQSLELITDIDVNIWSTHVRMCLNECAPLTKRRVRTVQKPRWLTAPVLDAMRTRDFWFKRYRKHRDIFQDCNRFFYFYVTYQNLVTKLIRRAKSDLDEDQFKNCSQQSF